MNAMTEPLLFKQTVAGEDDAADPEQHEPDDRIIECRYGKTDSQTCQYQSNNEPGQILFCYLKTNFHSVPRSLFKIRAYYNTRALKLKIRQYGQY